MSKIYKSIITKQLKSTIISLFRSSSSVKLFSTTNSSIKKPNLSTPPPNLPFLTSKQSLVSNSFSSARVTHGGGARNLCCISSFPLTDCEVNYQASSSSPEVNRTTQNIKRKNLCTTSVPVRAYCLSHRIDLMGLMTENEANLIPHTPGIGNYIVLRFDDLADSRFPFRHSYMVVFKYGSAVMFNMPDHGVDGYLKIIKRHASGMRPETTKEGGVCSQKYSDYEVREKRNLPTCVEGGLNHMLQNFNIDGICTIADVLGQSVALEYYSRLVDGLISEYTDVNIGLEESGTLRSYKKLVKMVPRTCADADICWFGLFERSEVAWKEDTEHAHMLGHLQDKFKLTQRYASLDRKFKMGELNIWFTSVGMGALEASLHMNAYVICIALILFLPVATVPINTLEAYIMSI